MAEKPNISASWGASKYIYILFPTVQPSLLRSADEKPTPPEDSSCTLSDFAALVDLRLSPRMGQAFP